MKLTLQNGKLVNQDGIEVENWQDFFSIERDGLWRKTKGGGFEKMRGETIDLPEGIEAEVIYQEAYVSGTGDRWEDCTKQRYNDTKYLDCKRQIIRLKPVEKKTVKKIRRPETCPPCGKQKDDPKSVCSNSFHFIPRPVVDAVEHNTQEKYPHLCVYTVSDIGLCICKYCGNQPGDNALTANTDTQEERPNNGWFGAYSKNFFNDPERGDCLQMKDVARMANGYESEINSIIKAIKQVVFDCRYHKDDDKSYLRNTIDCTRNELEKLTRRKYGRPEVV